MADFSSSINDLTCHRQENVQHLVYAVSIFVNFISIFDTDLEVFEQQGGHICKYE